MFVVNYYFFLIRDTDFGFIVFIFIIIIILWKYHIFNFNEIIFLKKLYIT